MPGVPLLPLLSGLLAMAGVVGIVTGLLLLWPVGKPTADRISMWLKTDLTTPRFIERHIYRHHRKSGVALIAAAILWLWLLTSLDAWRKFLALTWNYLGQITANGALPLLASALTAITVLVIGAILLFRPSWLKPLERRANRRLRPDRVWATDPTKQHRLVRIILNYPMSVGLGLLLAGIVCLFSVTRLNA